MKLGFYRLKLVTKVFLSYGILTARRASDCAFHGLYRSLRSRVMDSDILRRDCSPCLCIWSYISVLMSTGEVQHFYSFDEVGMVDVRRLGGLTYIVLGRALQGQILVNGDDA